MALLFADLLFDFQGRRGNGPLPQSHPAHRLLIPTLGVLGLIFFWTLGRRLRRSHETLEN